LKNDFSGVAVPEMPNQETECQKVKTDNSISDRVLDNTFHKADYRSDNPLEKSTRRCKNCGLLIASNSFDVHLHFCKIENGHKIITEKYPPNFKKIINGKRKGG
jgi:hypothetical protein